MDATTYAFAYYPALNNPIGGDIWINANQPNQSGNDYEIGQDGQHTIYHELDHAIGLNQPFDQTTTLAATEDTFKFAVMSYSDSPQHEDGGNSSFYPTTPMLLDIQAFQYLYGANNSYNIGNNMRLMTQPLTTKLFGMQVALTRFNILATQMILSTSLLALLAPQGRR